jgi:hypothetical protein
VAQFATAEDLVDWMGQDVPQSRADLLLQLASSAVVNAAGVPIVETTETITVDGNGASSMVLPSYPVTNVDQVKVDDDALDADGYTWSRTGELRRRGGRVWPARLRAIEVTYTHGYVVPGEGVDPADVTMPDEIQLVTLQAAARAVANPARFNSFGDPVAGNVGFGGGGDGARVIDLVRGEIDLVTRALR